MWLSCATEFLHTCGAARGNSCMWEFFCVGILGGGASWAAIGIRTQFAVGAVNAAGVYTIRCSLKSGMSIPLTVCLVLCKRVCRKGYCSHDVGQWRHYSIFHNNVNAWHPEIRQSAASFVVEEWLTSSFADRNGMGRNFISRDLLKATDMVDAVHRTTTAHAHATGHNFQLYEEYACYVTFNMAPFSCTLSFDIISNCMKILCHTLFRYNLQMYIPHIYHVAFNVAPFLCSATCSLCSCLVIWHKLYLVVPSCTTHLSN